MTHKAFLQWAVSIVIAILLVAFTFAVLLGIFHTESPRLNGVFGISRSKLEAAFLVGVAAALATVVVVLFGTTRGSLEFKALGVSFTGPSGPVLLWAVVFLAVTTALIIFRDGQSDEVRKTELEGCFLESGCRVAVHLGTQSLDLDNFTSRPGIEKFNIQKCSDAFHQDVKIEVTRKIVAYATKRNLQDNILRTCVVSGDVSCESVVSIEKFGAYKLDACSRFSIFGAYQIIGFLEE